MAQVTSATINPLPHAPSSLQHQDEAGLVLGRGRKGTKAVLEPEAVGPLMETPRSLPLYSDPSQLPVSSKLPFKTLCFPGTAFNVCVLK